MRVAYADPPYIGQAQRHYNSEEVDHVALVAELMTYDAWALSCSSPSLKYVLSLCPDEVRIAAWVKPFCSFKPGVNPAYTWEPVIFYGSRKRDRHALTIRDHLSENMTIQKGLAGAKPIKFCYWIFDLLGLTPEDEFFDLFPGTGIVTRCWNYWAYGKTDTDQLPLFEEDT